MSLQFTMMTMNSIFIAVWSVKNAAAPVERVDKNTSRFFADVFDASEVVPWIRTFICRITQVHFSDEKLEAQFKKDIEEMYRLYRVEGD